MDSLADLASVFARLNDCHFSIVDGRMESFAFYALNDDRQVAVRIGLLNSCLSDNEVRQLGLLLPVPPSLENDLKAAAQGRHGFLMRASPKLFGGDSWISVSARGPRS